MDSRPRLAVTMGDPAGVGPEICLSLLAHEETSKLCVPIVFGDASILRRVAALTGRPALARVYSLAQWPDAFADIREAAVLDLGILEAEAVLPGTVGAVTGGAAFAYVDKAIDAALAGQVAGVATAPLNKEALRMAGINFPGHTEIFAHRTQATRWCMMQYSTEITCTFVTVHVGYAEVPRLLNAARILEVIDLTGSAMRLLRGREPRLAVCGLNPHAGEHGLFGHGEEERVIIPAIAQARAAGWQVEGPLPPDTAFLPWKRRETDAFICMYHDQGHIPVKALAFDSAVNTTLGLPIIRTSVDHGTAMDIAWQGKANPASLFAAVRLAAQWAGKKAGP